LSFGGKQKRTLRLGSSPCGDVQLALVLSIHRLNSVGKVLLKASLGLGVTLMIGPLTIGAGEAVAVEHVEVDGFAAAFAHVRAGSAADVVVGAEAVDGVDATRSNWRAARTMICRVRTSMPQSRTVVPSALQRICRSGSVKAVQVPLSMRWTSSRARAWEFTYTQVITGL
jgi:hypothetical protein